MSIYSLTGATLQGVYSNDGSDMSAAYNKAGSVVFQKIPGRVITFQDDFNGSVLDETKWKYILGYGGANQELEQYWEKCVSIENGCLVLTANKVDNTGTVHQSWESGAVTTQDLFSQTYGRFEARIRFPNVVGAFPAFWMTGDSLHHEWEEEEHWTYTGHWPACGEIDIVEMIPGNANTAQANLWDSSSVAANPISLGSGRSSTYDPSEWHIYALEWTSEYMAMLLDGVEFKRYTWSNFTPEKVSAYVGENAEKMNITLNLAIGSSGGTPAESTSKMKMYVDWVRVYAPL